MTTPIAEDNNESFSLCSECGGECCRTKPGIESPERFTRTGDLGEELYRALASGEWVLDRHMGLPVTPETAGLPDRMDRITLYPRPATIEERASGAILAGEGGGICTFLQANGCRLSFSERPRMCRALEPNGNFHCTTSWGRPDAALAWFPWQETIGGLLHRLPQKDRSRHP